MASPGCSCCRFRERGFYLTPAAPGRGHMAAGTTEAHFWAQHVALSTNKAGLHIEVILLSIIPIPPPAHRVPYFPEITLFSPFAADSVNIFTPWVISPSISLEAYVLFGYQTKLFGSIRSCYFRIDKISMLIIILLSVGAVIHSMPTTYLLIWFSCKCSYQRYDILTLSEQRNSCTHEERCVGVLVLATYINIYTTIYPVAVT